MSVNTFPPILLSWQDCEIAAQRVVRLLQSDSHRPWKVYGVPRGGIYAALLVKAAWPEGVQLVDSVEAADCCVDDIIDSGATRDRYLGPGRPFFALFTKKADEGWYIFPWEQAAPEKDGEDCYRRLIEMVDNVQREGLRETPSRAFRAFRELTHGYFHDPREVLKKTFASEGDEMIVMRDIQFFSLCEHHLLPFFGKVHIGYLPKHVIAGASKLVRTVDVLSRRLQIQERLTSQIADTIQEALSPLGVIVVVEALHLCMAMRGIKQQTTFRTTACRGIFLRADVKDEFLAALKG